MASKRISEKDLVLPALFCIAKGEQIPTSQLIIELRDLLKPLGEDAELLTGRNDDKFSQKVRNLRSHNTLVGLANYEYGYWTLTDIGRSLIEENFHVLKYLIKQGFDYVTQQEALAKIRIKNNNEDDDLNLFDEEIVEFPVIEGKLRTVSTKIYERSAKLREIAIDRLKTDGNIFCKVCGFDFEKVYGSHGKGYIEIHHMKPIFSYGDEGVEKTLEEALNNLVPLCSNCHRMIHRTRTQMLSVEELKEFINQAKHNP